MEQIHERMHDDGRDGKVVMVRFRNDVGIIVTQKSSMHPEQAVCSERSSSPRDNANFMHFFRPPFYKAAFSSQHTHCTEAKPANVAWATRHRDESWSHWWQKTRRRGTRRGSEAVAEEEPERCAALFACGISGRLVFALPALVQGASATPVLFFWRSALYSATVKGSR